MPVLVGPGGLAALAPAGPATEVQGYGSDGDALAGWLFDHVLDRAGAGRPDSTRLRIRAYRPAPMSPPPPSTAPTPGSRWFQTHQPSPEWRMVTDMRAPAPRGSFGTVCCHRAGRRRP
jgi:hypothetical protein